jgi:hypothetical protein
MSTANHKSWRAMIRVLPQCCVDFVIALLAGLVVLGIDRLF